MRYCTRNSSDSLLKKISLALIKVCKYTNSKYGSHHREKGCAALGYKVGNVWPRVPWPQFLQRTQIIPFCFTLSGENKRSSYFT